MSLPPKPNFTNPPTVPSHQSTTNPRHQTECLLMDIGYLTGKPMKLTDPPLLPTQLANVMLVCDWWFFILFVISDFVLSRLRKKIRNLSFYFYFYFFLAVDWWQRWCWWWMWLMVEVVVVVVGAMEVLVVLFSWRKKIRDFGFFFFFLL